MTKQEFTHPHPISRREIDLHIDDLIRKLDEKLKREYTENKTYFLNKTKIIYKDIMPPQDYWPKSDNKRKN